MSQLALFFLGPPRIDRDGAPVEVGRRKVVALLAYLAITGKSHSRDALATMLWPEMDQIRARAALRRTLHELKKALGGGWLKVNREAVRLDQRSGVWLDVAQFRSLLATCQTHGHPESEVCSGCQRLLAEAVTLYSDDFLAGFTLRSNPDFDEWQFFQTESLKRELASALERLVISHSAQGEFEQGITYGRRWLMLDPLHEPAHFQLMQLYAWSGHRNAALRQYQKCAQTLEAELGVSPKASTLELNETIKANRVPPPPNKYSRTAQRTMAAATIYIPQRRWAGPLADRHEEIRRLKENLDAAIQGDGSLVFLTGEAGIGKTRLAYELSRYAERKGARFVMGRGREQEQNTPYRPWRGIIRACLSWVSPAVATKIEGTLDPELAKLVA